MKETNCMVWLIWMKRRQNGRDKLYGCGGSGLIGYDIVEQGREGGAVDLGEEDTERKGLTVWCGGSG